MEKDQQNNDDTLLARWLSGDLSEEEKVRIQTSGDDKILERIVQNVGHWSLPELKTEYYLGLQSKLRERQETKVIPMYKNKAVLSIAASLLLLVGLSVSYFLFFASNLVEYQCEAGQKRDIYLPDQSMVTLNGYSSISFDEKDFLKQREINLKGEAYFQVTKKGSFKVNFDKGVVEVLGTRFNIMSGKDLTTVKCYEGKVAVTANNIARQILTQGMGVRLLGKSVIDSIRINDTEPDWKKGENAFAETPLLEVINSISIQFNTQFEISNSIDLNRKFTGKYIHSDLDTALKMVFTPMGIEYSVEGEKRKIVTLK